MKYKTSYMINFSRSNCIEVIKNDGRPFYKRLERIGVLFDTKDGAVMWLKRKGMLIETQLKGEKQIKQRHTRTTGENT